MTVPTLYALWTMRAILVVILLVLSEYDFSAFRMFTRNESLDTFTQTMLIEGSERHSFTIVLRAMLLGAA